MHSVRTQRYIVGLVVLVLLAAACGEGQEEAAPAATGADDVSVEDWEPEWVDGVLQPLPTGWPDSEIVLLSRGGPAHRNGILMRALYEAMDGRSPVSLRIQDEVQGAHTGWADYQYVADEGPDGSIITIISMSGQISSYHQEPVEEEYGLHHSDLNILARLEAVPYVLGQRKDAPWGRSWPDLVEYAKANPMEVRYSAGTTGGGIDIVMTAILNEAGIPAGEIINKVPAGSQSEAVVVVGAGEGDFALSDAGTIRQHWEAGVVDPLWTTSPAVMEPWDDDPGMTTANELGFTDFYSTDLALVVGTDTPELNKAWLLELVRDAWEDEEYQESRRQAIPGIDLEFWGPEQTQEHMDFLYDLTDRVLRDLGMHGDQL